MRRHEKTDKTNRGQTTVKPYRGRPDTPGAARLPTAASTSLQKSSLPKA